MPKSNCRSIPKPNPDAEARKWARINKLGTTSPICHICGETDDRCLERHHAGQRKFDDLIIILCSNCHNKQSDAQKDHPKISDDAPEKLECIGRLLLGLAEFFSALAKKLVEYGHYLIELTVNRDHERKNVS